MKTGLYVAVFFPVGLAIMAYQACSELLKPAKVTTYDGGQFYR